MTCTMTYKSKAFLLAALLGCLTASIGYSAQPNVCPPSGCPDTGSGTYGIQVPVTRMVDVPYNVNFTRMVPVQREISVPRGRWVTERREVPAMRTIYVNEPYTVNETRYENRRVNRTRQVNRTVRDFEQRQITETVFDNVRDPYTGCMTRVPRQVCRTISVPVTRTVTVDEPCTVNVRVPVTVPVTKTRRVAREVPTTRTVNDRRWVTEMVRERVTEMQPVTETRVETRQEAVCTTELVPQRVGAPVPHNI